MRQGFILCCIDDPKLMCKYFHKLHQNNHTHKKICAMSLKMKERKKISIKVEQYSSKRMKIVEDLCLIYRFYGHLCEHSFTENCEMFFI